jgi:hypothetical protein
MQCLLRELGCKYRSNAKSTVLVRISGKNGPYRVKQAQYRVQKAETPMFLCSLGGKGV